MNEEAIDELFHALQLAHCGCEHWALLFDDIECEMSAEDQTSFASFADAQVAVTNELYDYLDKPNLLLFCPTGKT